MLIEITVFFNDTNEIFMVFLPNKVYGFVHNAYCFAITFISLNSLYKYQRLNTLFMQICLQITVLMIKTADIKTETTIKRQQRN
jgi:hypothetical protein